jgi:hypothetical protein
MRDVSDSQLLAIDFDELKVVDDDGTGGGRHDGLLPALVVEELKCFVAEVKSKNC